MRLRPRATLYVLAPGGGVAPRNTENAGVGGKRRRLPSLPIVKPAERRCNNLDTKRGRWNHNADSRRGTPIPCWPVRRRGLSGKSPTPLRGSRRQYQLWQTLPKRCDDARLFTEEEHRPGSIGRSARMSRERTCPEAPRPEGQTSISAWRRWRKAVRQMRGGNGDR